MTKDEELAMDLALEALEYIHEGANNQGPHTGISWRCVAVKAEPAIKAIKQARALDKMAENARELGLDYEPAEVLGHNGWGFPIKAAAPVQEDWGPGPHEYHSLTASVQEPVAWRYRGIFHEFDPSDWAEGPVTPLYTTPPAQPAPVQEPVWIRPDELQKAQKAPFLCRVGPNKRDDFVPLYPAPPAAQRQWVGLTDDELKAVTRLEGANSRAQLDLGKAFWAGARWAEAQLKEKNS